MNDQRAAEPSTAPEGSQGVCSFDGYARCPEGTPGCKGAACILDEPVPSLAKPLGAIKGPWFPAGVEVEYHGTWTWQPADGQPKPADEQLPDWQLQEQRDKARRKLRRARKALAAIADFFGVPDGLTPAEVAKWVGEYCDAANAEDRAQQAALRRERDEARRALQDLLPARAEAGRQLGALRPAVAEYADWCQEVGQHRRAAELRALLDPPTSTPDGPPTTSEGSQR